MTKFSVFIAYMSGSALLLSILMVITMPGVAGPVGSGNAFEKILTILLLAIGMIGLPVSMIIHDCRK
ncbi:hypothetical protein [Acidithiobacillus ferrooxidans]|uniref:hypothetical protein n=1 Tax=Acidithiobacillus ferrooxidans TaxID=920 RepID=UPI0013D56AF3|nr:hypothetical protein [Acidithiobacillus ferrooxidans]